MIGPIFCGGLDFIDLCVQVSLKHSGSLFMYAGHEGGAYAKNSFGNMYAHKRLRLSLCSPLLFSVHMFSFPTLLQLIGQEQMANRIKLSECFFARNMIVLVIHF